MKIFGTVNKVGEAMGNVSLGINVLVVFVDPSYENGWAVAMDMLDGALLGAGPPGWVLFVVKTGAETYVDVRDGVSENKASEERMQKFSDEQQAIKHQRQFRVILRQYQNGGKPDPWR